MGTGVLCSAKLSRNIFKTHVNTFVEIKLDVVLIQFRSVSEKVFVAFDSSHNPQSPPLSPINPKQLNSQREKQSRSDRFGHHVQTEYCRDH